jgi:hypothetical protein
MPDITKAARRLLLAMWVLLPLSAGAQSFTQLCAIDNLQLAAAGNRSIWAATSQPIQDPLDPHQSVYTFLYVPELNDCAYVPTLFTPSRPLFLATGGGSMVQPDETWAYFQNQGPFHFTSGVWNQPPLLQDPYARRYVVGVGYSDDAHPYEVWGERLAGNSWYLGRFNYRQFPHGVFVSVSTPDNLSHVATGGGEVWALDTTGHVFRFDGSAQVFNPMPGSLAQIAVGVDGVWGLDANGRAFEFNAVTQSWDALGSPQLDAIWAGGDGVFARQCTGPVFDGAILRTAPGAVIGSPIQCGTHQLMRYEPVTRTFVAITTAPQPLDLSVGSGAGAVGVGAVGVGPAGGFDPALHSLLQWTE